MGKTRWNEALIASADGKHRLVKDRWQWILQSRYGEERWRPLAFCATKEGLMLRAREVFPPEDPAWRFIEALPDFFPSERGKHARNRHDRVRDREPGAVPRGED